MKNALKLCASAAVCLMAATAPATLAQQADIQTPSPWNPDYEPPRMADGTPDFTGVWSKASITTIERSAQFDDLVVPPEIAQNAEEMRSRLFAERRTDPEEGAPPAGHNVGGYNAFWLDPGSNIGVVNGEYRSSWIVEPADGRLPYSEAGRAEMEAAVDAAWNNYDDPEVRSAAERCTVGYGSTGTPPMLNVLYNNHVQFYQTPEQVTILVEMNHNARIIRMNADHRAPELRQWLGDSVGHWDGDTLVVETTNFHPDISQRSSQAQRFYLQPDTLVEERFTRVADDTIFYEYTVTDPDIFTQPWRAEMPLWRAEGPIFEYACHEGNYSLPGILAGARREEAMAQSDNAGGGQ